MNKTCTYNKRNKYFKMHSPEFPYTSKSYIGYTFDDMKKKYREDYKLKGKHINWLIIEV